jgi:hypothetical protein
MAEPQEENLETIIKLGTQLKMKRHYLKEKVINQDQALEENQSNQALLLSFYLVLIEEEELLL